MSKFFIQRPIFATVLAIIMVLAGLITVKSLPVAQFPEITPPTVMVSASYPGADAQTVAQAVGVPIEEQVNGVEGMMYMSSICGSDGSYSLTVTFERGVDIVKAAADAGNIRFRPIMMTACAFVFGVIPMLFASGAGANSRIALASAVVFGMVVNALTGTLFVPDFWLIMQRFREKYMSKLFSGADQVSENNS